jgi:uncharacterized protein YycO
MYQTICTIKQTEHYLILSAKPGVALHSFFFAVDGMPVGSLFEGRVFYLDTRGLNPGYHIMEIAAINITGGIPFQVYQSFGFYAPAMRDEGKRDKEANRNTRGNFEPGDILVASDNVNGLDPGYMGHSALIIDGGSLLESVTSNPSIRRASIDQFLDDHKLYTHYRPKSQELGQKAVDFGLEYLKKYEENISNGIQEPLFDIYGFDPLEELWSTIYCSKLIWLCYYHGADYKFENDYLWFAPEDLDTVLSQDDNFELIYKHPDFNFHINV